MTRTEYLFGRTKDAYQPHVTILASRRIADATILMKQLSEMRETVSKEELPEVIERYMAAHKGREFWQEILDED